MLMSGHGTRRVIGVAAVMSAAYLGGQPAWAVQFDYGALDGSVDTTLSYGSSWRAHEQDRDIIGLTPDSAFGGLSGTNASVTGRAFSENADDGNQNYKNGQISNVVKFNTEVNLDYHQFGGFLRFTGFKDTVNDDAGDRTRLTPAARNLVGSRVNLLDAYLTSHFDLGTMPTQVRIGKQVLSWGESTFIQNGINIINPFDVSKLRTPGSEVRDALKPVWMVSASISPTDNTTIEAFYQLVYKRTILEPAGSFFSVNDAVGEGGQKVMLGFGSFSDRGTFIPTPLSGPGTGAFDPNFMAVPRAGDNKPKDGGQFGIAFKYLAEDFYDTEFGFYAVNYHSRVPVLNARTGTAAGAAGTLAAGTAAAVLGGGGSVAASIAAGTAAGGGTAAAAAAATKGVNCAIAGGAALASACATDLYARTASYSLEYPENIQMYGVSFNTQLGASGVALQGEYSFHHNVPLQVEDIELLFAALSPITGPNGNQLGSFGLNTKVPGFITRDISQFQVTASQVFGPTFKADQAVLLGELGVTHVHNMPSKDTLRLDSAATFISGNPLLAARQPGGQIESPSHFADATSWGYRVAGRLTYNNVLGSINVSPRFAWSHDVQGNTPGPGGNFLAGRKAITLGVGMDYQNEWQADISYTNFFGAGSHNLLNDRDFVAFNLKYSF